MAEYILVTTTGTGVAADKWGSTMGLYKRTSVKVNNAPAYQQLHDFHGTDTYFMYKYEDGDWQIGDELGGYSGILGVGLYNTNSSPAPPMSGWQYWNGDEWILDPELTAKPISDASAFLCPVINIKASGIAAEEWSVIMGQFTITSQFSSGHPVYTNTRGYKLRVHPEFSVWGVGDSVESGADGIHSGGAGSLCPASARSRYNNLHNYDSWQYVDDAFEWQDGDIEVTCTDPNIIC